MIPNCTFACFLLTIAPTAQAYDYPSRRMRAQCFGLQSYELFFISANYIAFFCIARLLFDEKH